MGSISASIGLSFAAEEISLVFFTTLAPAGAIAVLWLCAAAWRCMEDGTLFSRVNLFFCVPLVIALAGLVASTVHLGNPANALYVLTGAGRSPLSNEVLAAVVFLGVACLYWFYGFSLKQSRRLQAAWLALTAAVSLIFVLLVARAYSFETIISWDTLWSPVCLVAGSVTSGSLLALATLQAAGYRPHRRRMGSLLTLFASAALVLCLCALALQWGELEGMRSFGGAAVDRVPLYWVAALLLAVLGAGGCAVAWLQARGRVAPSLGWNIAACALTLTGVFAVRFCFYMVHMTAGIGL